MAQASANIKPDPSSIQTIVEMGFTEEQAKSALVKYNNNLETALNQLLIEGDTTENDPAVKEAMAESLKYEPGADLGVDMDQAIANSLQDMAGQDLTSFDPLNPMATQRMEGIPVGLKNVGNTCYFNSIIQSYQMMPNFVTELMKFVPHPSHFESNEDISKKK